MEPDLTALRRARLFELLRQQTLAEQTATRLRHSVRAELTRGETMMLRSLAAKSWTAP